MRFWSRRERRKKRKDEEIEREKFSFSSCVPLRSKYLMEQWRFLFCDETFGLFEDDAWGRTNYLRKVFSGAELPPTNTPLKLDMDDRGQWGTFEPPSTTSQFNRDFTERQEQRGGVASVWCNLENKHGFRSNPRVDTGGAEDGNHKVRRSVALTLVLPKRRELMEATVRPAIDALPLRRRRRRLSTVAVGRSNVDLRAGSGARGATL